MTDEEAPAGADSDSILVSIKKVLGLDREDPAYDLDLTLHINSVFSTLQQLGVGPKAGFSINDSSSKWDEFFLGVPNINQVKSYIYLKVRLLFDPPASATVLQSFEKTAQELEWRLNVQVDDYPHQNTAPEEVNV